jgi:FixJ family two-component response regulator
MSGMWQAIKHSLLARKADGRAVPARVSVVALVVSEEDRSILRAISLQEPVDIHFVESCPEVLVVAKQLIVPVILLDRDWPETEWRIAVEKLAALPQGACVILMSGVADDYLWQELIRRGGYDVLAKPLRTDDAARALKLALSHWRATAVQPGGVRVAGS